MWWLGRVFLDAASRWRVFIEVWEVVSACDPNFLESASKKIDEPPRRRFFGEGEGQADGGARLSHTSTTCTH